MSDYSSFQWAPPKDWDAFENFCHRLFMRVWEDPNVTRHGRRGQAQQGVDLSGRRPGADGPSGVQCKSKDRLVGAELSREEILREVEKAKAFKPPLGELIIATTAASDQPLDELAREITSEHAKTGLFSVHVWSWTELLTRLDAFPDLAGQLLSVPSSPVDLEEKALQANRHAELLSNQATMTQELALIRAQLTLPATDGPAHAKLDICRELLEQHQYRAVRLMLQKIRDQEWEGANAALKFRIATNLGAAHLGLSEYPRAGEYFLEAFQFDSVSAKALANRALGLLLLERRPDALRAAREAVERQPTSPLTWTALLNILPRVEPDTPLPDVPASIANDLNVLMVRADAFSMRRAWSDAESLLRHLLTLPGANPIAKSRLAEVLLAQSTGQGRFYAGAPYSAADIARMREAQRLLQESWEVIKRTELAQECLHIVQNHAAVCAVFGRIRDAEPMLEEALGIAPIEPGLLSWKIRAAVARDDGEAAARAFVKLVPGSVEEYPLLEAATARAKKDLKRALDVLEKFIRDTGTTELSDDARCLFADLVCEADPENAEARFNALPAAGTLTVARSTLIFAQALEERGFKERGQAYLAQAAELLSTDTDDRLQLLLADTHVRFEEYEAAVSIYEKRTSTASDNLSLREYLRCLFELDQRQRLSQLFSTIPAELLAKPWYEYMRANLAVRIGDYPDARLHLESCLAADPAKLPARFLWADVCLRLGDRPPVEAWLNTIDVRNEAWTLEQLLRMGPLFHAIDRKEDAAGVFYQALRRFPHDHRSHLGLTGSVLFKGSDAWTMPPDAAITADSACGLRDTDGRERVFILENLPEAALRPNETAFNSPVGARLLGRKVGDVVQFHSSDLANHESTVVWIKHKFIHALHESLADFNTQFPEVRSLIGFKLLDTGTPEEQLAPINKALHEKAERTTQILGAYQQGLPIAVLGTSMGRTPIEAWRSLIGRVDAPIRVCVGNAPERQAAMDLLTSKAGRFIVEPISLLELHHLNALDAAEHVCGRLAITQATLEELRGLIADLALHADGYKTIFEHNGQRYWHEVPPEEVAKESRVYQGLIEWAQKRCEIVPAVPRTDPKPDIAETLNRGLGHATYETLLAAQGHELVLVSDDGHLRRLAKDAFQVDGVWIQPILMRAREHNRLHPIDYNRAVISLVNWGHHFTSVAADQLLYAAIRARWNVSPDFERLAATLTLQHSELRSNFGVVWTFLGRIWRKNGGPTRRQAKALTDAILNGVDPRSSPANASYARGFEVLAEQGKISQSAFQAIADWYERRYG